MLAVDKRFRRGGIAKVLVQHTLEKMKSDGANECILETEITNKGALGLYESCGFVKQKRLGRYYLNGVDAFRLKYCFAEHGYLERLDYSDKMRISQIAMLARKGEISLD